MTENQIARIIVNSCFNIHNDYGPGLLESVYEKILEYELRKRGLAIDCQQPVPVFHDELKLEVGFRADLIVENKVIVEIKSVDGLAPVHFKQLRTYLRIAGMKLGLLINFNENLIKDGMRRVVNNL